MPLFSSDISSMVGGQVAMFNNQAQYAHQVGASMGIAPPMGGGGMVAPNFGPSYGRPSYGGQDFGVASYNAPGGLGSAFTTGVGGALPAAATGLSLAGGFGLMGRMGGYMDPLTGVGRAFAAGAGTSGIGGTLGGIGSAFAQGGARAGLGMVGGGLAAAALPFAGYMAAGAAISTVGENVAQGARNIAQVGQTAQQFIGPSYGMTGSRPGGGLPQAEIKGIVTALHEIAGQDVMTTMESVKRLMSQASQMGMLTGVTDAGTFKQKFSRVVEQVKSVAKIMGTTLEEAAPLLGQMQSMGLWRASDIMGTAGALQRVGAGARPQLMGAMQAGAMGSWQQGGTLAAGARLGGAQFENLQAAMRTGALTNEQLMEFTGGVGGTEGLQMMSQQMTGTMQKMGRVPMGRALMAGLGEQVEGRFTGRIDPKRLAQFQAGQTSLGEVMEQGYGRTRTREAAASYTFRSDQLGQDLASKGGMELVGTALQQMMNRAGYGKASEEIQGLFLQNMLGMNQREAQQWLDLTKKLPQMMEHKSRRERDQLRDQFRRLDEQQNRSWEGLKRAVAHRFEEAVERPLQELGESLSTAVNERMDSVTDMIYGRSYGLQRSTEGRQRDLISGRGGQGAAGFGAGGAAFGQGDFAEKLKGGTFIERLRTGKTRAETLAAMGAPTEQFTLRAGQELPGGFFPISETAEIGGTERGPMGMEASYTGNRIVKAARITDLELTARHAEMRAQGRTFSGMGIHMDSKTKPIVEDLKTAYRNLTMGMGPQTARLIELRKKYKEGDPEYNKELANLFASMPGVQGKIDTLLGGAGRLSGQQRLDALAAINAEVAGGESLALGADKTGFAKGLEFMTAFGSEAEEGKFIEGQAAELYSHLYSTKGTTAATGVGLGLIGAALGPGAGGLLAQFGAKPMEGILGETFGGRVSQTRLRDIMRGEESGSAMRRWVLSEGKDTEAARILEKTTGGRELMDRLVEMKEKDPTAFKEIAQGGAAALGYRREATLSAEEKRDRMSLAKRELSTVELVEGVTDKTRKEYERILQKASEGENVAEDVRTLAQRLDLGKGGDKEFAALEAAGGAFGQYIGRAGRLERVGRAAGGGREDVRARLEQTGLPMELIFKEREDIRKQYAAMFEKDSEGGVTATKDEISKFVEELKGISDRFGAKETKAGVADEKAVVEQKYIEANTRFVTAVDVALGAGKLSSAAGEVIRQGMDKEGTNPTLSGSGGAGTYGGR